MKRIILAVCAVASIYVGVCDEAFPPPCDPVPVKKSVKVVRREIAVSVIGLARPMLPKGRKPTVAECFRHWKYGMDKEIGNKPDLIVLPEGVDSWLGATPADKLDWVRRRGDLLLKEFQLYAKEHSAYLVFNSYRQRKDGRFANTSYLIDREGDVIGVYDKVYPTPGEILWKELPIVPGGSPVVVDTDFGRVGFAICFDLNFRDLIEAYRREKPDVICFSSASRRLLAARMGLHLPKLLRRGDAWRTRQGRMGSVRRGDIPFAGIFPHGDFPHQHQLPCMPS